jgi:hypothetical protein
MHDLVTHSEEGALEVPGVITPIQRHSMHNPAPENEEVQNRIIEQIVELQREFYFENKGKDTERRRRLREIIERNTTMERSQPCG